MKKIIDLTESEYNAFVLNHQKAHFLESYEWGIFCKNAKKQIPHYVGIKENDNILAACLILEKKTPLKYSYGYSPRGFIIDYNNKDLIKEFTDALKDYMKENNYIYIKFDPDISYQDIDENGLKIEGGNNNYDLYNYMISLGYKHTGFYKNYEGNQPRYTFRIDLNNSWEDIEKKFNKSFLKSIKRSYNYDIVIDNNIDVDNFFRLHEANSNKDDFNPHSKDYFQKFTDAMKPNLKYFNASINPRGLVIKFNEEIKKIEDELNNNPKKKEDLENQLAKLKKDVLEFSKYDCDKLVICSLICTYTTKYAWSLYIGSDVLGNMTFAVSRCYYEAIKDAFDNNYVFFDLFGTVGDPNTKYKNLSHLHDFKRKFGDKYIEFIGEFDLVNKKFLYKVLPVLLKIYRKIKRV